MATRQERSASGSCRSTNAPDGAVARRIRRSKHQGRLQLVDRAVDLFAERHPVELVEHRAVEALADAVGLRALGLCPAVVDLSLIHI